MDFIIFTLWFIITIIHAYFVIIKDNKDIGSVGFLCLYFFLTVFYAVQAFTSL